MRRLAHDEVRELLPWWANRTLEVDERRAVEAHLASCGACRAEAADERRLVALLAGTGDDAPLPHPGCYERLVARIDAAEAAEIAEAVERTGAVERTEAVERSGSVGSGEHETQSRPPRPGPPRMGAIARLRRVIALETAALLVLAVVAAVLGFREPAGSPPEAPAATAAEFRTLGEDATPAAAPRPDERLLRVVFAPDAPEADLRELLLGVGGRLVDGPSALGAYTVAVPAAEPLALVLEHLRARPEVRLAEPVVGSEGG